MIAGSVLKFGFLYGSITIFISMVSDIKPQQAAALTSMFNGPSCSQRWLEAPLHWRSSGLQEEALEYRE